MGEPVEGSSSFRQKRKRIRARDSLSNTSVNLTTKREVDALQRS